MLTHLLLSAVLSPGQPPVVLPDAPPPPMPAPAPPIPCAVFPGDVVASPDGTKTLFTHTVHGTPVGDLLARCRVNVGGFLDLRYTATPTDNLSKIPYGMGLSYNRDIPQRVWATAERPLDKMCDDPSWGFRVDFLAGSAYQYTMQQGLLTYQLRDKDGLPNRIGYDLPQFYADFFLPCAAEGMEIKVGRSFTRFGYESLNASQTILPSYSYARTFTPFTQTGLFTETKVNHEWWVQSDFVIGNDVWFENAARFYWWGGMRYASEDCRSTFQGGVLLGNGTYDAGNQKHNLQLVDTVFTHKFRENLTYAFEFLYGWQFDVPDIGFAQFYGFVNYLTYDWNPKWSSTLRVEFFDDVDGTRTGFPGFYGSYTLGLTWKPCEAVMIRPEVRYDRCNNAHAFDGSKEFFGAMINAILVW